MKYNMNKTLFAISFMLLLLLLSSCNMAKNAEFSSLEINKVIVDSIEIVSSQNLILFDSIHAHSSNRSQVEPSAIVLYYITDHNRLIDSVKNLILSNSKSTSDMQSTTRFLVDDGLAMRVKENAAFIKPALSKLLQESGTVVPKEYCEFISPNDSGPYADENWDEALFNQLPVYAAVPVLNRWRLENVKCGRLMLSRILRDVLRDGE